MLKTVKIAILMGGNLGNSAEIFAEAVRKLEANGVKEIRQSRLHRTAPVDCVPGTPEFSNAALTGEWSRSAETLLELTQRLEREAGRPACHSSRESRTLDLDLILFGERCSNSPVLTLPHPRARQRRFVLEPLAEIAPEMRFPDTGESVAEALHRLEKAEKEERFGENRGVCGENSRKKRS